MNQSQASIRLRKVKDPPRTCSMMKKDELLSRPSKPIWSTERHSVVISDEITLLNDLGVKVCSWNRNLFGKTVDLSQFRFYVDEYKEFIYPYLDEKENGVVLYKVPFKDCSLTDKVTLSKLEFPNCEKPKIVSKKRKKKNLNITKQITKKGKT